MHFNALFVNQGKSYIRNVSKIIKSLDEIGQEKAMFFSIV